VLVFRPRLFEALREYDRAAFLSDLAAGITVGVVTLPLAFGFAIAWGVEPSRGLWTAFIAGVMLVVMGVPRNMENSVWTAGN
jgi:SulP family sulfate permease